MFSEIDVNVSVSDNPQSWHCHTNSRLSVTPIRNMKLQACALAYLRILFGHNSEYDIDHKTTIDNLRALQAFHTFLAVILKVEKIKLRNKDIRDDHLFAEFPQSFQQECQSVSTNHLEPSIAGVPYREGHQFRGGGRSLRAFVLTSYHLIHFVAVVD